MSLISTAEARPVNSGEYEYVSLTTRAKHAAALHTSMYYFLTAPELGICCIVSREWRQIGSSNQLWSQHALQLIKKFKHTPQLEQMVRSGLPEIKTIFGTHEQNRKLVRDIDRFINDIPLGTRAVFVCETVYGPLTIEVDAQAKKRAHLTNSKSLFNPSKGALQWRYPALQNIAQGPLTTVGSLLQDLPDMSCSRQWHWNGQTTQRVGSTKTHQFPGILKNNRHIAVRFSIPIVPEESSLVKTCLEVSISNILKTKLQQLQNGEAPARPNGSCLPFCRVP